MAAEVKLRTLRGILRELKLLYQSRGPTRQMFGYSYLLSEYRRMRAVDESMAHLMNKNAENYLSLLKSERIKEELHEYYTGSGESRTEDVARRVGFEIPNTDKPPRKNDDSTEI